MRLDRLNRAMAGYVERGEIPGIVALVSRREEVQVTFVGNKAVGGSDPMQRDTIFRVASLTKPVAAVAAMILVEECKLRLDEPVDRLLPELADRKVLKRVDSPLDDTVPANRPITVRDLLTLRLGLGHILEAPPDCPLQKAFNQYSLLQGPPRPRETPEPDEWMRRVGALPLVHQPGEKWMYDIGLDILGVLIARAVGQSLGDFFQERIFAPLGMKDTAFFVPAEKRDRFATQYEPDSETGELTLFDSAEESQWNEPPAFPSASGGLVSTVHDYLAFGRMLLNKGKYGSERILSRLSVEAMTTNQITPSQKEGAEIFLEENRGWGLGMSVITHRDSLSAVPGRFGWDGGLGTSFYVDPQEEVIGVLLTQVAWTSPQSPEVGVDFWTSLYQAIDD